MNEIAREILPVNLEEEMRRSYLDYAMSVIVGRALPDVRDGLKPVHRRILHAMRELGNDWNRAYKKSARVVGDVIGKYHPHGDNAVYDALVRMAQDFSMRYLLVDGQGNFGSVDGDAPAAMRYTEVRMSRITSELLADIEKETVDFVPNYDNSEKEPAVMPARFPNLLVNGSSGIAVGMATNIPPHNLTEIVNACLAVLDSPEVTLAELMQHVPGPDFPTAGIINGATEIATAYRTGRGRLSIRARTHFEDLDKGGRQSIIVTELPYQVNKARLLERIAELVRNKEIDGISELRDESDKDGMRVVIELKRGEVAEVVLNNLFAQTPLETVFGINMVALIEGQPKLLGLKEMLEAFIRHRREVVTRRTIFDLAKARDRAHVLEGLAIALANIDEVIALIRQSPTPVEAKDGLMSRHWKSGAVPAMLARAGEISTRPQGLATEFGLLGDGGSYKLSDTQAQAILDMRLHRLTGLEQDKIISEFQELLALIVDLTDILARPERLTQVVREELIAIRDQYGDERRTEINRDHLDLSTEDLIEPQDVVVTLSHAGYAKSQPVTEYQVQRRGGRGKAATQVKDEDFIEKLFVAHTHDTILCFSNRGKVYWKRVFELPQAGRGSRGKPMVNLLPLEEGEKINAILPIKQYDDDHFVFMATSQGTVKKTPLSAFSRPRASGIIAVGLDEGDRLVGVALTDGKREIILSSNGGKSIRFNEEEVRPMGREATGVRGIKLADGQELISLIVVGDGLVLTASANGYGKLTPLEDFPAHGRGGQGVIALQTTERNGEMVAALQVNAEHELMLISSTGTLVRTPVGEISIVGRNTQGVRLIRLGEGERLTGVERIDSLPEEAGNPDPRPESLGSGEEGPSDTPTS
ncbi:MAG TPA: DNA gyrase subunit A [Steroidobacteraceae bacterium]|nr:DNA gyrase subunit A [Steroidobacteraceae bacterium]